MSARAAVVAGLVVCMLGAPARAASPEHAYQLINEWRTEEAAAEVAKLVRARPQDPAVLLVEGDLAFEEGRYAEGADLLGRAAARAPHGGEIARDARDLEALARATDQVTHGFAEKRSSGGHFVIRYAPGKDALLADAAGDTLERSYAALGEDFGARPPGPVRVEIYGSIDDLAQVSTLTLKEIQTSGTIALCKFNRLMIVSPRALLEGYPWLDTLNHEYTHFVVSRISHNTVPIWLHEGLAKFEERRWRAAPDSKEGLTPTMEHLLAQGLARHHLITFAQMSPSMAKLPSQEDTALAFAEVYTVVEYLHDRVGAQGIRRLIARMRAGDSDGAAVAAVTGESFDHFQRDWRAWLHTQPLHLHPSLVPTPLRFKKGRGKEEASDDVAAQVSEQRARKFARLGGLMRARHRLRAAAVEYEKAQSLTGADNPLVANKLGRTYLELGEPDRAVAAAKPTLALYPDLAAPNATVGEAYLAKGDLAHAGPYLEAALRVSPFDPAVRCGLARVYAQARDPRAAREKNACLQLGGD